MSIFDPKSLTPGTKVALPTFMPSFKDGINQIVVLEVCERTDDERGWHLSDGSWIADNHMEIDGTVIS